MTESAERPESTRVLRGGARAPGDSPEMARGRQAFDEAGPSMVWLGLGLLFSALVAFLWWRVPEIREGNRDIAAFELVGNAADALAMDRTYVGAVLGFDVFFIFAYVLVLYWAARFFGRFYRLRMARTTACVLAGRLVLAAGLLDLVEDGLLALGVASDYRSDWWVSWVWPAASIAAWAKFLLLLVVVAYVIGGLMVVVAGPWFHRGVAAWKQLTDFAALLWSDPEPRKHQMTAVMEAEPKRKFGIALSGGGIRASSITLGALQVLERDDETDPLGWGNADVVTAISGGSNMAGAWSISRGARIDAPPAPQPSPDAWRSVSATDPKTLEESHLLHNLGYLLARSPRGDASDPISPMYPATNQTSTGDDDPAGAGPTPQQVATDAVPPPVVDSRPSAYATVFTGFVINASVLLLTLWLVVQPLGRFYGWLGSAPFPCRVWVAPTRQFECVKGSPLLVRPALITLVLGLVGIVVWVVVAKLLDGNSPVVKGARWVATGLLAGGAILVIGLVLFPYAMWGVGWVTTGGATSGAVLAALGSLSAVGRVLMKPAARFAPVLGGVVFFVLVVFLASYWAYGAATTPDQFWGDRWSLHGLGWWLVGVLTLVVVHIGATPEWWSLAGFYRGKLRLAYATYREQGRLRTYKNDDALESESDRPEPDLHSFLVRQPGQPDGTPLTVCAAATVSSRAVRTHYNIPAMSTTFNPEQVTVFVPLDDEGRFAEWSCGTGRLDAVRSRVSTPRLTTMLAVAIASAAVSPAMGRFRVGPTSMLLAFANIRLGVWLPNPRFAACAPEGMRFPRVRLPYLFKEFVGLHDPSDAYMYLTDGGHWENTGLVELLRKGDFREIVCIDADPGPGDAVKSISEAIDLAVLECGATVSIDLDPMRANPPTSRKPEYSDRSVNVGIFVLADGSVGVLWYAKPALVTDMPAALLAFRETHPSFPRISTLNQFFDTSTFVAYRDLGRFNAQVIRAARRELKEVLVEKPTFEALGGIAYPHWAVAQIASQIRRIETSTEARQGLYELVRQAILPDGNEAAGG